MEELDKTPKTNPAPDAGLKAIQNKTLSVRELYEKLGSDVTDYHRKSAI